MSDGAGSKPGSELVKSGADPATAQSADSGGRLARTAMTAVSTLLVLLTVVGLGLLMMRRQRTEDLDDHYSRMAAHIAQEVERRLESERAVAETLAQAVPVLDATLAAGRTLATAEANVKHVEAAAALVDGLARAATEETGAGQGRGAGADETRLMQQRAANAKKAVGSAKDAADEALHEAQVAATETQASERATSAVKSAGETRGAESGPSETHAAGKARRESATARERAATATERAEKTAAEANDALSATEVDAKKWLALHGVSDEKERAPDPGAKPAPAAAPALKKALAELEKTRAAVESAKRDLERTGGMPSYRKFGNDCLAASPAELSLCFTRAIVREVLRSPPSWDVVACNGSRARAGSETFVLFPLTADTAGQLCLRVPLADAVLGADGNDAAGMGDRNFDEVVLVGRRDGAVLFAEGRDAQARMSTLPGFDAKTAGVSRRNTEVEIGSARYRLFLQPIALAVPLLGPTVPGGEPPSQAKPREDSTLLLAGLVREERFGTELYQVPPTSFLWAAALVAMAVFSWPLAKLWLVGPRTRFGRIDAAFLVTSAAIATALSALLFPMLLAEASLGQRLDRQLLEVADQIAAQLDEQVASAARALDTFVTQTANFRQVLASSDDRSKWPEIRAACETLSHAEHEAATDSEDEPEEERTPASPAALLSEVTYRDDERRWPFCELVSAPSLLTGQPATGQGELAFWVNREGLQQLKRVTGQQGTPAVAVTGRNYFQQAIDGKAYPLGPASPSGATLLGVPEVVRSVTSSQKVLLVARPTAEEGKITGVAAVEAKIGALRAPALPKGFQMAAVRSDGVVMLHSKLDSHHGHSFFEDLGGRAGGELKALMAAGTSGEIDARYRGTPSRLRVQLDPGTGWFIVVIATQGLLDVVVTDTALSTLGCLGIFALLLGGIAALAAIVRGSRAKLSGDALAGHVLSLRPHARFSPVYADAGQRLLGAAGVLAVVTLAVGCFVPTTLLVLVAVGLAVWAGLSVPGLWRPMQAPARQPSTAASWRDDLPTAYAMACFGLANVFIIFPTIVFFMGGHCAAVGNLLRAEQDHYRTLLESRPACLAAPSIKGSEACSDVFWPPDMRRVEAVDDPVDTAWFSSPGLWPASTLSDRLPLYTSAKYDTALLARASPDAHPPPPRSWVRSGSTLHLQPQAKGWALESDLPRLLAFENWGWPALVVALFVALTAGANAIAYQTIQRLFFTDVLTERRGAWAVKGRLTPDALARELAPSRRTRILVLHPPCELSAKLRQDPRFARLNELASPCTPPKTIAFIPDLEPLLATPIWADRLLEAAETEPSLLVLCSVDPLRQGPAEQRRTWAMALKDFRVVGGPGRPIPTAVAKNTHGLLPGEQPSEAAYMHEWITSDDDEQRVLAQLAIDGYASPHPRNAPTLRHLTARGLLDADSLTLRDDDFRDFLRRTVSSDDLHVWQTRETALAWRAVRLPLSAGVTILLVLLGVSRPDLAETGALLPPVVAGLPVLLRVLAAMASGKKSATA